MAHVKAPERSAGGYCLKACPRKGRRVQLVSYSIEAYSIEATHPGESEGEQDYPREASPAIRITMIPGHTAAVHSGRSLAARKTSNSGSAQIPTTTTAAALAAVPAAAHRPSVGSGCPSCASSARAKYAGPSTCA